MRLLKASADQRRGLLLKLDVLWIEARQALGRNKGRPDHGARHQALGHLRLAQLCEMVCGPVVPRGRRNRPI
jgi:hypothetical protein